MKNRYPLFLLLFLPWFALAQTTTISGVINDYAVVNNITYCNGRLVLSTTDGFEAGQAVILIQMKGATIDESNSSSFGTVTNLGTAGRYEVNRIASVASNEVFLENELLYTYDLNASLQLITFPEYEDVEVTGTLTAPDWNGQTGGILAFRATGSVTLSAPIDVSHTGFRGGDVSVVNSNCQWFLNENDYYYSSSNWRGAPKGEGIADLILGKEKGRGPQANGGGGGNDHNSGGGGGSNNVAGGQGGENTPSSIFGCSGTNPGIGGRPISPASLRLWPGGGGGAGHTDDTGAGSAGGRGGGVVIIQADNLVGNSQWIRAAGQDAPQAGGDGAGGGGGGGAIVLDINNAVSPANIDIRGGDGGSVSNISDRCDGPGGGGSGGRLLTFNPILVDQVQLQGGANGINLNPSTVCDNPANGAQDGNNGLQSPHSGLPEADVPLEPVVLEMDVPSPIQGCLDGDLNIELVATGADLEYQWQVNTGGGSFSNLTDGPDYAGTQTPTLTLFNLQSDQQGYEYRCIIVSDCYGTIISNEGSLEIQDIPVAAFDAAADGLTLELTDQSTMADSIIWYFGDGQSSNESNPVYTYSEGGIYEILQIVTNFCGTDTATLQLQVFAFPSAGFIADNTAPCIGDTVFFTNQSEGDSLSYTWLFPGGEPDTSSLTDPFTVYPEAGVYTITLIVQNPAGSDTLVLSEYIEVEGLPAGNFNLTQNGYSIEVDTVNISPNTTSIQWDFGDGTVSTQAPETHTYGQEGIYPVVLELINSCGTTEIVDTLSVGAPPVADLTAEFTGGCTPLSIFYNNLSSGDNLTYEWIFPGGEPMNSTEENPQVTYNDPGIFDVTLIATNNLGSDTLVIEDYMEVLPFPEAAFSVTTSGDTAFFTNLTVGSNLSFEWDFGDGNNSSAVNPTHIYDQNDTYEVTLLVTNTYCGDVASQFLMIGPNSSSPLLGERIRLYPNPSEGSLFLEGDLSDLQVQIFDLRGRRVLERSGIALPFQWDGTHLPGGVYWIRLEKRGQEQVLKWIKTD